MATGGDPRASGAAPGGLRVLHASAIRWEEPRTTSPHRHGCAEIFCPLAGEGRFQVEARDFPVRPGDLVVVPPGVTHAEVGVAGSGLQFLMLGVEGLEALIGAENEGRYSLFHTGEDREDIVGCLWGIHREMDGRGIHFEAIAYKLLEVLVFRLARLGAVGKEASAAFSGNRECLRVKQYIDRHITDNVTLDTLAEVAHINKYYLVHLFSAEYGVSPVRYLIGRRIEESRYFLAQTDHTIAQISQILCFSSPSYFSQSFRSVEGISPREYRRRAARVE